MTTPTATTMTTTAMTMPATMKMAMMTKWEGYDRRRMVFERKFFICLVGFTAVPMW